MGQERRDEGYKFGDITKSIFKKTTKAVTGKKDYEFGDITKTIVDKTTGSINNITGNDKYQFGDISKALDQLAKEKATQFTKKQEYQVGDISKEILRRVWEGEYKIEDIFLLFKVLLTFGAEFSPLASALPAKIIFEMINFSLAQEVSKKVMGVLASSLDKRLKESLTGDSNYQIGDLTKRAILQFIGKDEYEFGDISRTISKLSNDPQRRISLNPELLE